MKKRTLALLLALMLIIGATVGGTIAWLTSKTDAVVNTFTVGDINITLQEHPLKEDGSGQVDETAKTVAAVEYDYVPGDTLGKDPFVTVEADSEDCYVFIKVEEKNNSIENIAQVIQFKVDETVWTPVPNHDETNFRYYYRTVTKNETQNQDFYILAPKNTTGDWADKDNVVISTEVTKEMVTKLNEKKPQLIFTAAAIQKDNVGDVEAAWTQLFGTNP